MDSACVLQNRMDQKRVLIGSLLACMLFLAAGIAIGYFALNKSDSKDEKNEVVGPVLATDSDCGTTSYSEQMKTYKDAYSQKHKNTTCYTVDCNTENLRRNYIAYHLNGKTINIDGKLDDEAWQEVPWTENFVDIRGRDYPVPHLDTKVKVRWDDERLYIGARMDETDFWGSDAYSKDESQVWRENSFEMYAVPDGSFHNYKQIMINVRNVKWDVMVKKPFISNALVCPVQSLIVPWWSSDLKKATYTDGTINDINGKGTHWNVEVSFTFKALASSTDRENGQEKPVDQEVWFSAYSRMRTDWWAWQPTYAINTHLPSRFGFVQFKKSMQEKDFYFEKWHIYQALFEVFEAELKYKATTNTYISELTRLDISPKFLSSKCVEIEVTEITAKNFQVNVRSKINDNLQTDHIRADRYVWFS